jgi:hypothetical protein
VGLFRLFVTLDGVINVDSELRFVILQELNVD